MDRTTSYGYVINDGLRGFADENLLGGVNGTDVLAADAMAWQEELMGVIEGAGLVGSSADLKQVFAAIQLLISRGVSAGYSSGYNAGGNSSFWRIAPDGFVEQGGIIVGTNTASAGSTLAFVTFPIPFPSGQAPIVSADLAYAVSGVTVAAFGASSTGFGVVIEGGNYTITWSAKWH